MSSFDATVFYHNPAPLEGRRLHDPPRPGRRDPGGHPDGGQPETHADSTAVCTHFKQRAGFVGADRAEAQVFRHAAGTAVRFWVYGPDFSVRVRDLVILPTPDKGADVWLEIDGKLFPHEGKYFVAALSVMANVLAGR